ncbi:MAG: hypothetical protein WCP06_02460 [Verrucomicrobiota bacterium]
MKTVTSLLAALSLTGSLPLFAEDKAADTKELKGEILDMACYLDHGASGEKHSGCATKCIGSGLPVGIKAEDGKIYFVIGEHKPMNQELAAYAGKTVTLRGKVVSRDGINLLENAELAK